MKQHVRLSRANVCWTTQVPIWKTTEKLSAKQRGLSRDLNPGPPAPKAGIIPLDQQATIAI